MWFKSQKMWVIYLEAAKMFPLRAPNVEKAINKGVSHAIDPIVLALNV